MKLEQTDDYPPQTENYPPQAEKPGSRTYNIVDIVDLRQTRNAWKDAKAILHSPKCTDILLPLSSFFLSLDCDFGEFMKSAK